MKIINNIDVNLVSGGKFMTDVDVIVVEQFADQHGKYAGYCSGIATVFFMGSYGAAGLVASVPLAYAAYETTRQLVRNYIFNYLGLP